MSDRLLIQLGVALCALLAGASLLRAITTRRRQQPRDTPGARMRALAAILRPEEEAAVDELQSRTTRAGLYGKDALDLFLTIRLAALVVGAGLLVVVLSTLSSQPLLAVGASIFIGTAALAGPGSWLEIRARRRQREISAVLPRALDLLGVCLGAGLSLQQALARLVSAGIEQGGRSDLLGQELELVLADMKIGMSTQAAFRRFAARIGSDDVTTMAMLVGKGAALGAKMADMLREHADVTRRQQLLRLEETAGKANAKIVIPVSLCLMPAVLLLMVGPTLLSLLRSF